MDFLDFIIVLLIFFIIIFFLIFLNDLVVIFFIAFSEVIVEGIGVILINFTGDVVELIDISFLVKEQSKNRVFHYIFLVVDCSLDLSGRF